MRTKAINLIKGNWYADVDSANPTFLRFDHYDEYNDLVFDDATEEFYDRSNDGKVRFFNMNPFYLPTEEDALEFNLPNYAQV